MTWYITGTSSTIVIKDITNFTVLSSRQLGYTIRNDYIIPLLKQVDYILLDFTAIEDVTLTFLDELFGVLITPENYEEYQKKIIFINTKDEIKKEIEFTFQNRITLNKKIT